MPITCEMQTIDDNGAGGTGGQREQLVTAFPSYRVSEEEMKSFDLVTGPGLFVLFHHISSHYVWKSA